MNSLPELPVTAPADYPPDPQLDPEYFRFIKSGPYKWAYQTKWIRDNTGTHILTCPFCGMQLDTESCGHWFRDHAGFRYRWVTKQVFRPTGDP